MLPFDPRKQKCETTFQLLKKMIANLSIINPFVPNAPFLYPLKKYGFLMFSEGTERVNWERMG